MVNNYWEFNKGRVCIWTTKADPGATYRSFGFHIDRRGTASGIVGYWHVGISFYKWSIQADFMKDRETVAIFT